jgi:hypothetical protein
MKIPVARTKRRSGACFARQIAIFSTATSRNARVTLILTPRDTLTACPPISTLRTIACAPRPGRRRLVTAITDPVAVSARGLAAITDPVAVSARGLAAITDPVAVSVCRVAAITAPMAKGGAPPPRPVTRRPMIGSRARNVVLSRAVVPSPAVVPVTGCGGSRRSRRSPGRARRRGRRRGRRP